MYLTYRRKIRQVPPEKPWLLCVNSIVIKMNVFVNNGNYFLLKTVDEHERPLYLNGVADWMINEKDG